MKKKGQITKEIGAIPEKHELQTADALALAGYNVKFLKPISNHKTPDIELNAQKWEIKSIKKNGKYTVQHAIRSGLKQAENIIFDLRRLKTSHNNVFAKITKQFALTKKWRRLIIIGKDGKLRIASSKNVIKTVTG